MQYVLSNSHFKFGETLEIPTIFRQGFRVVVKYGHPNGGSEFSLRNCPNAATEAIKEAPETGGTSDTIPPLLFIDVFAGCGGLSLGLKRAGWQGLFAIEKDPFAFETLSTNFLSGANHFSYNWPESIEKKAWDIDELLAMRAGALSALSGKVDLLAGGPPCQGFSYAGRRRANDPRNRLFEAYLELVEILRPRLVLIENVRGFASDFNASKCGTARNFSSELQQALSTDYDVKSTIIQARNFGVPQTRPRFFLIGALKDMGAGCQIAAFFDDMENQRDDFLIERQLPRQPTARDAISDLEVVRNGTVPSIDSNGFDAIAYKEPRTAYQKVMHNGCDGTPPDMRLARHRPHIRDRFAAIIRACHEEGKFGAAASEGIRKTHGLKKTAVRVLDPLSVAPTITSLPEDILHYSEPRTLTVRENARLQSFPDWFAFKGNYTTGGHRRRNETPRFTQVANAVPPLLAEQLGLILFRIASRFHSTKLIVDSPADTGECFPMFSKLSSEIGHPAIVDNNNPVSRN